MQKPTLCIKRAHSRNMQEMNTPHEHLLLLVSDLQLFEDSQVSNGQKQALANAINMSFCFTSGSDGRDTRGGLFLFHAAKVRLFSDTCKKNDKFVEKICIYAKKAVSLHPNL